MSVLSAAQVAPVIAMVLSRIAGRYAALLGLEVSPLPGSLTFLPVKMVWANHADSDPANGWLRQQIRDSIACSPVGGQESHVSRKIKDECVVSGHS
ncbi:hypothetical protein [Agrobacterium vitis]|uniref:hypothetical protein n=1 Tax=Agrobacterium vitis TaxID=373 RepID=UPI0018D224FB|nr:hypothetical protein [Agrobacterium vitis]